jgi:site-specific DNA-methyltransferase (adenine-specific)
LKPAHEPIVLARKPLDGTVANNVLTHGLGGINIDGCRVDFVSDDDREESIAKNQHQNFGTEPMTNNTVYGDYSMMKPTNYNPPGRFPANFIHDGSDEVLELFPDSKGGAYPAKRGQAVNTAFASSQETEGGFRKMGDIGSAARFFYCAKANKTDRNEGLDDFAPKRDADRIATDGVGGENPRNRTNTAKVNHHPTVKPTTLMRYLCRLITPPHGTILDPFTGSGSTGKAAVLEGFNFIGIELDPDYIAIAEARIQHAYNQHH